MNESKEVEPSIEDVLEVLRSSKCICYVRYNHLEGKFSREITFEVRRNKYTIQWWANIRYLFIDEVQIPFHNLAISGTWPNKFDRNLQLTYNNKTCCIIPIEKHRRIK